jgi:hypothetical protein
MPFSGVLPLHSLSRQTACECQDSQSHLPNTEPENRSPAKLLGTRRPYLSTTVCMRFTHADSPVHGNSVSIIRIKLIVLGRCVSNIKSLPECRGSLPSIPLFRTWQSSLAWVSVYKIYFFTLNCNNWMRRLVRFVLIETAWTQFDFLQTCVGL